MQYNRYRQEHRWLLMDFFMWSSIYGKVFKNGQNKICERQPFKNLK